MPRITDPAKIAYPIVLQPELATDANGNPVWVQRSINQGGQITVTPVPASAPAWPA